MRSTVFSLLLYPVLFFCCIAAIAQQSSQPATPVPQHLEDLSAAAQGSKSGALQSSPEIQSLIKALSGKWSVKVPDMRPNCRRQSEIIQYGRVQDACHGPDIGSILLQQRAPFIQQALHFDARRRSQIARRRKV